jgi:hypothetical protein
MFLHQLFSKPYRAESLNISWEYSLMRKDFQYELNRPEIKAQVDYSTR